MHRRLQPLTQIIPEPLARVLVGAVIGASAVAIRFWIPIPVTTIPLVTIFPAMLIAALLAGRLGGVSAGISGGIFVIPSGVSQSEMAATLVGLVVAGVCVLWAVESYGKAEKRVLAEHILALGLVAEQKDIFAREMDHRMKNVLQTVQAIAEQTFGYDHPKIDEFTDRVMAISASHRLLLYSEDGKTADLQEVIHTAIKPFKHGTNIKVEGETCMVDEQQLLWMSLALHELSTNATKYGALKAESGEVRIRVVKKDEGTQMVWEENGGPLVAPPTATDGFGTTLLKKAQAKVEFRPTGVVCKFPPLQCAS